MDEGDGRVGRSRRYAAAAVTLHAAGTGASGWCGGRAGRARAEARPGRSARTKIPAAECSVGVVIHQLGETLHGDGPSLIQRQFRIATCALSSRRARRATWLIVLPSVMASISATERGGGVDENKRPVSGNCESFGRACPSKSGCRRPQVQAAGPGMMDVVLHPRFGENRFVDL